MKKNHRWVMPLTVSLAFLAALQIGTAQGAPALCVNPGGTGGCHGSIQAAVDDAAPGQTINVASGIYTEQVVVSQSVDIRGAGPGSTILQAPASLVVETDGVGESIVEVTGAGTQASIERLTVQGALGGITTAIHIHNGATADISNNVISGTGALTGTLAGTLAGHGITVGSPLNGEADGPATATIYGNLVTGFHRAGIVVTGVGSSGRISQNTVTGAGPTASTIQSAITIQDGAAGLIHANEISNVGYTASPASTAVAIFLWDSADGIAITNNRIVDAQTGILLQAAVDIAMVGNKIADAPGGVAVDKGIWLLGRGSANTGCVGGDGVTPGLGCTTSAQIQGNILSGNGVGVGIVIGKTVDVAFTPAASSACLRGNNISDWDTDIAVLGTGSITC